MATFCSVCYCSYNIGVLSTCSFLKRFKTTKLGETNLNRRCCSVFFWRKSSVYPSVERSSCWGRTWWTDLLDEAMVHSNVTSLLCLRIRDPELDCHECVASGLRQHSRRQLRFWFWQPSENRNVETVQYHLPDLCLWRKFSSLLSLKFDHLLSKRSNFPCLAILSNIVSSTPGIDHWV